MNCAFLVVGDVSLGLDDDEYVGLCLDDVKDLKLGRMMTEMLVLAWMITKMSLLLAARVKFLKVALPETLC